MPQGKPLSTLHPKQDTTLQHLVALFNQAHFDELIERAGSIPQNQPDAAVVFNLAGAANVSLKRPTAALAMFDRAIRVKPDFAVAHYNRGVALQDMGRLDEAVASYGRAIHCKPDHAAAHYNRGNALRELNRTEDAIACFNSTLDIIPDHIGALNNRAVALHQLGRLDEAITSFDQALRIKPDLGAALSQMLHLRAQICDWTAPAIDPATVSTAGCPPLAMLALDDDPQRQLERARAHMAAQGATIPFPPTARPERLRIGYFSADFHNHATMSLMAGLFEAHDRRGFEIHAFSYGPHSRDALRQRLRSAVEHFHDVGSVNDEQVATKARDLGIDIAVDLKGYTQGGRPGIFACRAAPIQIAYLGFPGTMGQAFIDYIIADRVVIPESDRDYFAEKVIYLPGSYQVNDNRRPVGRRTSRADHGLPESGFVFCCFNASYKITPAEFGIWMRLLSKVDGSVLWLLKDNHWAEANLRKEAAARGIDPARLIFAPRVPEAEHLARQKCADLFLDTFKCNAHTTASDALWAGLPVVTMLGRSFAARVAGSLLNAVGLPELVTGTLGEYEALALDLATDPIRLAEVKVRLAANRVNAPMFDTERTTRNIEHAYQAAFERYLDGREPAHFAVAR